jgi:hypothetical protein
MIAQSMSLLWESYAKEIPYYGLDTSDIKDKVLKDSSLPSKVSLKKSVLAISKPRMT